MKKLGNKIMHMHKNITLYQINVINGVIPAKAGI